MRETASAPNITARIPKWNFGHTNKFIRIMYTSIEYLKIFVLCGWYNVRSILIRECPYGLETQFNSIQLNIVCAVITINTPNTNHCSHTFIHGFVFWLCVFGFFFLFFSFISLSKIEPFMYVYMMTYFAVWMCWTFMSVLNILIGLFGHWYISFRLTRVRIVCFKVEWTNPSADCSALWFIHYYKCVTHSTTIVSLKNIHTERSLQARVLLLLLLLLAASVGDIKYIGKKNNIVLCSLLRLTVRHTVYCVHGVL